MSDLRGNPDLSAFSLLLSLTHFLFCSFSVSFKHFVHFPKSPSFKISPLPATSPYILSSSPSVLLLFSSLPAGVDLFLFSSAERAGRRQLDPPSDASLGPDRSPAGLSVSRSAGRPPLQTLHLFLFLFLVSRHRKWGHLSWSIQADAQRCSKTTSHYLAFPSLCFVSLRGCASVPLVSLYLSLSLFIMMSYVTTN